MTSSLDCYSFEFGYSYHTHFRPGQRYIYQISKTILDGPLSETNHSTYNRKSQGNFAVCERIDVNVAWSCRVFHGFFV